MIRRKLVYVSRYISLKKKNTYQMMPGMPGGIPRYNDYAMKKLLQELKSMQNICELGRASIVSEVLEKQRNLYAAALDVMPSQ